MTKNIIITASEVQQGDKIKVTIKGIVDGGRTMHRSYEGVAHSSATGVWRTEGDCNLYAHETGAVIELLERPIPKVDVPSGDKAIVTYDVASFDPHNPKRIAHRNDSGKWTAYDPEGQRMDTHYSDEEFGRFLAAASHPHEVVFGGTK